MNFKGRGKQKLFMTVFKRYGLLVIKKDFNKLFNKIIRKYQQPQYPGSQAFQINLITLEAAK